MFPHKTRPLQVKTSSMGYLVKFHAGKRRLLKAVLENVNCAIDINNVTQRARHCEVCHGDNPIF